MKHWRSRDRQNCSYLLRHNPTRSIILKALTLLSIFPTSYTPGLSLHPLYCTHFKHELTAFTLRNSLSSIFFLFSYSKPKSHPCKHADFLLYKLVSTFHGSHETSYAASILLLWPITKGDFKNGNSWPAICIGQGLGLLCLDGMQYWSEDPPRFCKFVNAYKVDLTAAEHVQDQTLVCIGHLDALHNIQR